MDRPAPGLSPGTATSTSDRLLRYAAALYAIGLVAHNADHIRRGTSVITAEVFWAGIVSTAIAVGIIALIVARHRLAPAVALGAIPIGIGVAAVHLLPHWSALSDAFPGAQATGVSPMSWAVVLLEIAGALAVGACGVHILARQGDTWHGRGHGTQ